MYTSYSLRYGPMFLVIAWKLKSNQLGFLHWNMALSENCVPQNFMTSWLHDHLFHMVNQMKHDDTVFKSFKSMIFCPPVSASSASVLNVCRNEDRIPFVATVHHKAATDVRLFRALAEWWFFYSCSPWRILTVLPYMVTWIPLIYPLYVSIYIPAPWIRHG